MTPTQTRPGSAVQEMLVNVVLDRSGSMASNSDGTISGYNEFLHGLKVDKETKYNITLVQFDSPHTGPELTVSYTDKPLDEVPPLTEKTYEPRGGTPLHDAIGECIRRVDAKGRPVMVVIITDGAENSSREFTLETIKKLIDEKEGEGWKFTFIGADIDSYATGASYGIGASNIANYTKGYEKDLYGTVAVSASFHASNVRSHGMSRMTSNMDTIGELNRSKMTGGKPDATATPKEEDKAAESGTKWTVRS